MAIYLSLSLLVSWGMNQFKDASSIAIEKDKERLQRSRLDPQGTGARHA
jgi:hypothetical protein